MLLNNSSLGAKGWCKVSGTSHYAFEPVFCTFPSELKKPFLFLKMKNETILETTGQSLRELSPKFLRSQINSLLKKRYSITQAIWLQELILNTRCSYVFYRDCTLQNNNNGFVSTALLDLSKAFGSIQHDLLYQKLYSLGFERSYLQLIQAFTQQRLKKILIDYMKSDWMEIYQDVPQGIVLGPLLFNIYVNDLIIHINNQCNTKMIP